MFSIQNVLGDSKTAIYTFFGDVKGEYTPEMIPYMGVGSTSTINVPFIVQIELPSNYYFSSSQPPPVEYYVKENNRWVMFSMDFLNGQYAQTIVCNFENTFYQSLKELLIFLIGVLSTFSISFAIEAWTSSKGNSSVAEKPKESKSNDNNFRLRSIKRMALFIFIVSLFAIGGFLLTATLEKEFSIFLNFITGFVAGLLGILLGFLLDRASEHDNDNQTKEDFLKLIREELEEIKKKLEHSTNKVEVFYTDIWDSAVSSGVIRLFAPEQVVKISKTYKSVKNFSFESEFVKRGFEQLENLTEKQKQQDPFLEARRSMELTGENSKNRKTLIQEIDKLLEEKWWK